MKTVKTEGSEPHGIPLSAVFGSFWSKDRVGLQVFGIAWFLRSLQIPQQGHALKYDRNAALGEGGERGGRERGAGRGGAGAPRAFSGSVHCLEAGEELARGLLNRLKFLRGDLAIEHCKDGYLDEV